MKSKGKEKAEIRTKQGTVPQNYVEVYIDKIFKQFLRNFKKNFYLCTLKSI